ncbi:IPExxxVDY family protein [Wenyingzhuangia sp. 2_MG-2023]|uniref:IPExxxVDY family protein n=1 Tax=Wenyingzhuangia sp. 2_MG-2023 TaxID=3062639 RepID=UPI0026E4932F|nr:IPExxxVDY family protein [Wenyingzhuangia sp. 2_MG-2023]MDO6736593.1 IPExxxVDY family protein [Wenyingzhuangia sp. 2_MG-2023]MDO6801112.1 IPExxxVDY family protein [Wenyingzhuangia sp. 1_MG-2023]
MAANHLTLCDFEEQNYYIIAVHSVLQDFKLAYLLNSHLHFKFGRISPDLDYVIEGKKACFSAFEYQDKKNLIDWYLVRNKFEIQSLEVKSLGLFDTESSFSSTYVYLQSELKDADYILKAQGDFEELEIKQLLKKINQVEGVITSYTVDIKKLNHKEYLIF